MRIQPFDNMSYSIQKNGTSTKERDSTFNSEADSLELPIRATLVTFTMVLVIVGNAIVLLVIYRQRRRPSVRVANMFIGNLALVDFSIGVLLFPFSVVTILLHRWAFGHAFCQLNGTINMTAGAASILTMAVISFDRYRAIVSPPGSKLKKRQAWILLAVLWTVSITIGILPVLGWNKYEHSPLHTTCKMSFTEDQGYIIVVAVTCFLIPLCVMVYCYFRVFLKVRRHYKQMQRWGHSRTGERNFRRETKTARVVFTVLFVFVACWTPFVFVYVLHAVSSIDLSRTVFHSVTLIAGVHSSCNPIIYTVMNATFRNDLLRMCPCAQCGILKRCGCHDRVQPFDTETELDEVQH